MLGAVIEARSRGVGKLDTDKNRKVSNREAQRDIGNDLASQLAELAARVTTEAKKAPASRPRPPVHPRPSPVSPGC